VHRVPIRLRGIVRLNGLLQAGEPCGPELGQEVLQGLQPVRSDRVESPLTLPVHVDQPCFLQYLQMLGDGLLGHVEVSGDLAHRPRLVPDQAKHRLAPRLRERP